MLSNIAFQQRVWCASPQGLLDTVWKALMEIHRTLQSLRNPQWEIGLNMINLAFCQCNFKVEKTFIFSNNTCYYPSKMLAPWKKSYDQPKQHIQKRRHYFADKGPSSQSYGFCSSDVWMWELDYKESWIPKNWCFELLCWKRLLRVPWTVRRSNQSILKEISPEYSLDWCWSWSSNTLATYCEELTHWKRPWWWERLKAGEGDDRGWDGRMASPTWWRWVWVSCGSWWWTGKPGVLQFMGSQSWTQPSDWTELIIPQD